MKILITGATGDVGARVVRDLLDRGIRPRIFVRSESKARALFGERAEIVVGDLAEPSSFRAALQDVTALYLVNVGPKIPELDSSAARIAKEMGVEKIVKLSSLDVEHGLAIGAWHEEGEAAIKAVGIPFTFLRPTGFMSNLLAWAPSIRSEGVVRSSTANGHRPFIHSDDIAAVSVEALLSDVYLGQALALTGPESLTFGDATAIIAEAIGRPLKYEMLTDEAAGERYSKMSSSQAETDAHLALWKAIREDRLAAVTQDVVRILGRPAKSLRQWVMENVGSFS